LKRGEELDKAIESSDSLADLGLRYDLTVPLTRFYASNQADLPKVFKAVQTGPVWRAERPQKGRYRQFNQCDIDILGDETTDAELELLTASMEVLDRLGLTDAMIRINHRGYLNRVMGKLSVEDPAGVLITVDKLDKIGLDGVKKELSEKYDNALAERVTNWLSEESEMPEELADLNLSNPRIKFDKTLVRGMGYYTGAVFEIEHPGSGQSIGGGGRYDGMVGRWLGKDVPAVGISLGFERVVDLVTKEFDKKPSVVLVYDDIENALALQAQAIEAGYNTRIEKRVKNMKALLDSMTEQGYGNFAVLNGEHIFTNLEIKPLG
ncbi:MAG TPA: ATP phosphoribosyltransferase regulatory subunit, partial [Microbacteriaceae bacterium]